MSRFTFRNFQVGKNGVGASVWFFSVCRLFLTHNDGADAIVDVGNQLLDLTRYRAAPAGADEVPLPDDDAPAGGNAGGPRADAAIVDALVGAGFAYESARR